MKLMTKVLAFIAFAISATAVFTIYLQLTNNVLNPIFMGAFGLCLLATILTVLIKSRKKDDFKKVP
jgi:hypothetical protein